MTVRFLPTDLRGAMLIEIEPVRDERGFFARSFCEREFADYGLETRFVQQSISRTSLKGSVRGMHFQRGPASEVKVVGCARGAILDVIVDLRRGSPTHGRWQGFELTADEHNSLYIPRGFAHGFQALTDDAEVKYLISEFYAPDAAGGVRHDDPAFAISWPLPVASISQKDRSWPDYDGRGI
jgi:dTDP-4-dehydrorhamnose 3,5-epimerase